MPGFIFPNTLVNLGIEVTPKSTSIELDVGKYAVSFGLDVGNCQDPSVSLDLGVAGCDQDSAVAVGIEVTGVPSVSVDVAV